MHRSARALVLVEGASDRAALLALAARQGRDLDEELVEVVNLGGATNVGRFLEDLAAEGRRPRLAGLYDAPEERYFRRGLERGGHGPSRTVRASRSWGSSPANPISRPS